MSTCKGCYTYGVDVEACVINGMNPLNPCPCRDCIIKMVCKLGCEDLDDYLYWGRNNDAKRV